MHPHITPVILCGGSGTRLWPLSRRSYPKQFVDIIGEGTLFQQAALRCAGKGFEPPVIVTNSDFRFIVTQQLSQVGIDPDAVLIEPSARNTAPALLAAALVQAQTDPQAIMLAAPSDHLITDLVAFHDTLARGAVRAAEGAIVTLGISPDRPETGYGYLELDAPAQTQGTQSLTRFVEKPDAVRAAEMLTAGNYLWNAGLFLYQAQTLINAFDLYAPDMLRAVRGAVETAQTDLGFLRLAPAPWDACADISIDYAIMEKAGNLGVAVHAGDWSDMGGWEAIRQHGMPDANGVATSGDVTAMECHDTLLRSESEGLHLVGLGLHDIVVIAMADAVLVADRTRVGDAKQVVKQLRLDAVPQADTLPKDYRPWGYFETLTLAPRFQVKRIVVYPGASLSLQSHMHRAEHWIVVVGTARVTIDDDIKMVSENQSVYIPLGAKHRMENPGKVPMELIEVQTGSYLGEDDITRYDDVYSRGQGAKG